MRVSLLALCLALTACKPRPITARTIGVADAGARDIYRLGCGSCHMIPGVVGAHGKVGPSLEGVAGRIYIAGQLSNQPLNMERWIQHPHSIHDGSLMPELGVTDAESRDIAAYLYTLN